LRAHGGGDRPGERTRGARPVAARRPPEPDDPDRPPEPRLPPEHRLSGPRRPLPLLHRRAPVSARARGPAIPRDRPAVTMPAMAPRSFVAIAALSTGACAGPTRLAAMPAA